MKARKHLPMYGVGPVYGATVVLSAALGIALARAGRLPPAGYGILRIPLSALGIALIASGAWLWHGAVFRARLDDHIRGNTLATSGVYAWVRNPIYSAFLLACTGALLLANNLWLLALPPLYWLFLTVLMKHTEEKWLAALHGAKYAAYCAQVNRCIPRPPKRWNVPARGKRGA